MPINVSCVTSWRTPNPCDIKMTWRMHSRQWEQLVTAYLPRMGYHTDTTDAQPTMRAARNSVLLTTSKSDDSYTEIVPHHFYKATTVTEIVLHHFQKWRQLQRSYTWPLSKATTVTEIVLDHFQKRRQLQRSYLTTSKSDDSYRDRTSAYSKSDDSHRDHRQIEAFVRDFLQKRISKVNFWRQSHGASPRQARGRLNPPFRGAYFRRRSSALFLAQNTAFREPAIYPNHTSSCKNDNSYRDRTWPLPKATTVTEIVLDHFQKWRQLQRSYLTTSKSDDSYRDRTSPLPKVTTVTEIVPQRTPKVTTVTEIIAKSKLSCETSFKNESPKSIFDDSHTGQARGKPAAGWTRRFAELTFRRRSSALFLAQNTAFREPAIYPNHISSCKNDNSYRDRIWPLPKATTVTEIVLDHFQKWRQLQRSYLTTSKSDDSYRDRTSPLPKVTTVTKIVPHHFPKVTTVTEIVLDHFQKRRQFTEIVIDPFQKRRQLQRSYLTTSQSDDSYKDPSQNEAFVR